LTKDKVRQAMLQRDGMASRKCYEPPDLPAVLDFPASLLFKPRHQRQVTMLEAADRDPLRYKQIPEVNTRQRDAPSGAFWLCVLFLSPIAPTFPPDAETTRKT
jgi:hypothetical protein